jgi:hypothetical protein
MLVLAKREKKLHDVPFIEFQKEPPARKGFLEKGKLNELIALLPTHLRPLGDVPVLLRLSHRGDIAN